MRFAPTMHADAVNDAALIRIEPYGEADDHVRRSRRVGPDGRPYA